MVTQVVKTLATTSILVASPNPSNCGSTVTFTDTVSASSGAPGGTVTFYSCTTNTCGTKTSLGTGTLSSGKATLTTSGLPGRAPPTSRLSTRPQATTAVRRSNVIAQVVKAVSISTSTALTVLAQPLQCAARPVTFTATVSAGSGTPSGLGDLLQLHHQHLRHQDVARHGDPQLGQGHTDHVGLPVGTTYVEAVYGASGNYTASTSNVVAQVVQLVPTTSNLTSSPNPSIYGTSVTFTDTVSAASGVPGGPVTFYSCTTNTCGTRTSLGTGTLGSGKATLTTSSLPVGTSSSRRSTAARPTTPGRPQTWWCQVVLSVPSCLRVGALQRRHQWEPGEPLRLGTNGNDLIYAFGASYWINGFTGNDCIDVGDGNNVIFDGNGNDSVVGGDGWDTVILGDGNDRVSLGNGSDGVETGDGTDTVTVGNGSQSEIIVGNGNDTVTVGSGSSNQIELGRGTDTVTIQGPGSHDVIDGGNGNETVFLGSGSFNTYNGQAHHTNVCHLPKPPASWHGTVAAYYHDTFNNCTVVTP